MDPSTLRACIALNKTSLFSETRHCSQAQAPRPGLRCPNISVRIYVTTIQVMKSCLWPVVTNERSGMHAAQSSKEDEQRLTFASRQNKPNLSSDNPEAHVPMYSFFIPSSMGRRAH